MNMLLAIKALFGVAGVGAGALVPITINKLNKVAPKVVKDNLKRVFEVAKKEVTTNRKNIKVQKALKDLKNKGCRLIKNTQNNSDVFNTFYACKGSDNSTSFYYLGTENLFEGENEVFAKKVTVVNYEGGLEGKAEQLSLALEGGETIKWSIASQNNSGWAHFKNVNLSEKCKIETQLLGGEVLNCKLDSSDSSGSTFSYTFAIL